MPTVPSTWLITALMAIACAAVLSSRGPPLLARGLLAGFLATLGMIGALLGLRFSLGVSWAGSLQPHVAVLVAPLAYLGFRALMVDRSHWSTRVFWIHGGIQLAAQVGIAIRVILADGIVLAVTGLYLAGLVGLARREADAFIHVPNHAMPGLRICLLGTMGLLTLSILADSLVMVVGELKGPSYALRLLGGASGGFSAFVFILVLIGLPLMLRRPLTPRIAAAPVVSPMASPDDRRLLERIEEMFDRDRLYRDGALTVARLARRLGVPARDVTHATNRAAGETFSRYVNGFRIRHACRMLRETDQSITDIMLDAGFVSKSSFNTEFRRVLGRTPSQYRAAVAEGRAGPEPRSVEDPSKGA